MVQYQLKNKLTNKGCSTGSAILWKSLQKKKGFTLYISLVLSKWLTENSENVLHTPFRFGIVTSAAPSISNTSATGAVPSGFVDSFSMLFSKSDFGLILSFQGKKYMVDRTNSHGWRSRQYFPVALGKICIAVKRGSSSASTTSCFLSLYLTWVS